MAEACSERRLSSLLSPCPLPTEYILGGMNIYLLESGIDLTQDLAQHNLIVIFASTGSGKTTLLLNAITDKPVLYLVNRQALNMDVQHRLEKLKNQNITLQTYQYLEYHRDELKDFLAQFDVIICDEAHYWTSDCKFSTTTFLSFEAVMSCPAKKILITASGQALFGLLASNRYRYEGTSWGHTTIQELQEANEYTSDEFKHVNIINPNKGKTNAIIKTSYYLQEMGIMEMKMYCFIDQYRHEVEFHLVSRNTFETELLQLPSDKKAIVFTDKVDNGSMTTSRKGMIGYAELLAAEEKTVSMLCSSANKTEYSKYQMEQFRNELLNNERFDSQYLIATTTIDNGINISDDTVRYVFCDFSSIDPVTVQQCIGRVRLPGEMMAEHLHVYIVEKSYAEIETMCGKYSKWVSDKNKYISHQMSQAEEQQFYASDAFRKFFHIKNGSVELDYPKSIAMGYEKHCLDYHSHYEAIRRQLSVSIEMISSEIERNRAEKKTNMATTLEEIVSQNFLTENNTFPLQTMAKSEKAMIVEFAQSISPSRKPPKQIQRINAVFSDKKIPLQVTHSEKRQNNQRLWDIQYASGITFQEVDSVSIDGKYTWIDYSFQFDTDSDVWIPLSEIDKIVECERKRFRNQNRFQKNIKFTVKEEIA